MRSFCITVLFILGCAGKKGATTPSASADGPRKASQIALTSLVPFWVPGESMRFDISMGGIKGAHGTLVVGQPYTHEDGRRIVVVRTVARSGKVLGMLKSVYEETISWLDSGTGVPLRRRAIAGTPPTQTRWDSRFDDTKVVVTERNPSQLSTQKTHERPAAATLEPLSTLGYLRAWLEESTSQATFYVFTGGRIMFHEASKRSVETVRTPSGTLRALHIEVRAFETDAKSGFQRGAHVPREDYEIWVAEDSTRRPVRMTMPHRLGKLRLDMSAYQRPSRRR